MTAATGLHLLWILLAGSVLFAVVVLIHEWAHFMVARAFGIGTPCFSIGFGPTLWSRRAADGTLYRIGWFPLGGYVKMKGELQAAPHANAESNQGSDHMQAKAREQSSADGQVQGEDFLAKPIWQRMLVVLAGPFSNFILAVILFWALAWHGETLVKPVVGQVVANSIAAQGGLRGGDQIIGVDGRPTQDWQHVLLQLTAHLGQAQALELQVLRTTAASPLAAGHQAKTSGAQPLPVRQHRLQLAVANWKNDALSPQPLQTLGIMPYHPMFPIQIDKLLTGGAAQAAGLQQGDRILAINSQPIASWQQLQQTLQQQRGQRIQLQVQRQQRLLKRDLSLPRQAQSQSGHHLLLGIEMHPRAWPAAMLMRQQPSLMQAAAKALSDVGYYVALNVRVLWHLLSGQLSVKTLGGPIMIFHVAGQAAHVGWLVYIKLIAVVSVLVGFFNLLPIPLVDGGVFMFQVVEWVRAKPAPLWLQNSCTYVGLMLIIYLFVQATMNDVLRLL